MAIIEIVALIVAIAVLARSSGMVVDGAVKLADFFKIGHMATGFLLVSVATSLPELMVSIISGFEGHGSIAVGNVFGSNIANVLLVLGIAALLYKIKPKMKEWKEITFVLLVVTILTGLLIYASALNVIGGLALILVFGWYVRRILQKKVDVHIMNNVNRKEAMHAFLKFAIGMTIVLISAEFVVDLAVDLASSLGLAESFIGATVIAIGTSVPELALDIQAIRKKRYGLALGDAIGSSMSNITLVLGTAALFSPIVLDIPIFVIFMIFSVLANLVLFYFINTSKKLDRKVGAFFLIFYIFYLILMFNAQLQTM